MGASNTDIALAIVSKGERAHFSAIKGVGHLIWDTRLGIFSDSKPDAASALGFIVGSDWEDCVETLDSPLKHPTYGSVTIDFDRKMVTDANGYGESNRMFLQWLISSLAKAKDGQDGYIPRESVLDHIRNGRIQLECRGLPVGEKLQASSPDEAYAAALRMCNQASEAGSFIDSATICLPADWAIVRK